MPSFLLDISFVDALVQCFFVWFSGLGKVKRRTVTKAIILKSFGFKLVGGYEVGFKRIGGVVDWIGSAVKDFQGRVLSFASSTLGFISLYFLIYSDPLCE